MAFRIEVKSIVPDPRARQKLGIFNHLGLFGRVKKVEIISAYTIDVKLKPNLAKEAGELLSNPLTEKFSLMGIIRGPFNYAVEISYLPGVTDNVGSTARETLADGLKLNFKQGQGVYFSQVFLIYLEKSKYKGDKEKEILDMQKIAQSLYNPLIQKAGIKNFAELKKEKGFGLNLPKVQLRQKVNVQKINLNLPDEELESLGRLGILDEKTKQRRGPLALGIEELKAIRNHFYKLGRKPTDVEIEALGQTWSEHCKHTIFNDPLDEISDGIYRHYIKRATQVVREQKKNKDFCISVFSDNSGGIIFNDKYLITHKVETHNTPSALDPFGGAITGIVGVNRDTLGFGLGAKPVINVYGFCLADPKDKSELFRDAGLAQKMLSARRIMDGVISGVNAGGNQSGIPTNSGFLFFDKRYRGKPLVFAGTVGLIPRKINGKPGHIKNPKPGDLIVILGGRTGLDGIHGATFSSETLSKDSPATAVQIGDPITQKKFSDALAKEARDAGLYSAITDDGAGGLSSSVGEMATFTNGCEVFLHKVPLKYPGLQPWQIWISESQERMTLAVPKNKWKKLQNLLKKRGVEATAIGQFTNSGKCVVKYKNQTVLDLELEFLHDGRPVKYQISKEYQVASSKHQGKENKDQKNAILNLLSSPNITSTEFVAMQYDHEVQGSSITKPIQGKGRVISEATVTRPVLDSQKGVVLSFGINPEYSDMNTYDMAAVAIDTAVKTAICAGADLDHLALLDNFCWYSGNDPESLHRLKQAAKACFDIATSYGTPFISGKDSMFNDFKGFDSNGNPVKISIPPTLLISAISVMKDVAKAITIDLKIPGDVIYLLGKTYNDIKVRVLDNFKLYKSLQAAIEKNLVASAISVGRGGLAAALCKTAIAGQLGVKVDIKDDLFSESQGRIIVSVDPKKAKQFEKIFEGTPIARVGTSTDDKLININGIQIKTEEAAKAYKSTFKNY